MRQYLPACVLLAATLCTSADAADIKTGPAPWAALTSAPAAMKVAFDQVCLPAILQNRSIEELALYNRLLPVDPKRAGATPSDKVWRLASLGDVYVVAWTDGSCSSSSERGDPGELSSQVLAAVAANGVILQEGETEPARDSGRRTAWCSPGPQPSVLTIITREKARARRPAIVTTLFKARGDAPSFCRASPPPVAGSPAR